MPVRAATPATVRRHALAIVAACAFALTASPRLDAQPAARNNTVPILGVDTVLDARAKSIASRLRCPVCQGESIQDSPAELAAQMKTLVREQLANGQSESQVFEYFTQRYGQSILLEPKAEGLNLLVYGLPILFLVVGGGGIVVAVKRWTRPVAPSDRAG